MVVLRKSICLGPLCDLKAELITFLMEYHFYEKYDQHKLWVFRLGYFKAIYI